VFTTRVTDRAKRLSDFVLFDIGCRKGYEATSPSAAPAIEKTSHYYSLLQQVVEDRGALNTGGGEHGVRVHYHRGDCRASRTAACRSAILLSCQCLQLGQGASRIARGRAWVGKAN
jgi:hypothetical protein